MQIIRPDMWPLITGILILSLAIIGLIGIVLLLNGIKSLRQKNTTSLSIIKIVLGCLSVGFVFYNWFGYNSIFSKNEKLIVGEYKSTKTKLTINPDYTWEITGVRESSCKTGKWEYVMSEDWCYWNIESDNLKYRTQIGSPKIGSPPIIEFKEQNLLFKRK